MPKSFTIPSIFKAIDKFSAPLKGMGKAVTDFCKRGAEDVARFEREFRKLGDSAKNVAKKSAIVGFALAAPLVIAARDAIKFEDQMADVSKTTGITGKNLDLLGNKILDLAPDTRTSIDELQKIAAIGGSMHVAERELTGFTDSVNKFNVALGSDFGGVEEASKKVSGLKTLFKETRNVPIAEAITKTGSAINALSAQGVNVPELTEFISRVGQLPDAIKPSIQNTAALGAVFNKAGITAEIASRAFGDILLTAAQNLPKFAKQMKITQKEAANLINTNPTAFVQKFSQSLNGLNAQQLAKTLKGLKLTDAGAIKAVGALSSSTKMLADFQKIANDEYARGTSLLNEYNSKNNTTAGVLQQSLNGFKAISITAGKELLPVINDLLKSFIPFAKGMLEWARNHRGTVKTVLMLTGAISALSLVISGISSIVYLFTQVMLFFNTTIKGVTIAQHLWTAAQWLFNASLFGCPIVWIIAGIAALVAIIVVVIKKWNEWGAALSLFLGPLGLIIGMIQSFRRNWEMITKAFREGGILEGLKAIGKTILDVILMPMQQLLQIIAKLTGAEWASSFANNIESFRDSLGVNTETDESGEPLVKKRLLNPDVSRANSREYNSTLTINDNTGRGELDNDNPGISMPKLSTTAY